METKIKWNEGDGYITATYEGSGSGSASISSDVNEGIDREQSITIETTKGNNPKSESVVVTQIGRREVFLPSDGDFILADGGTFNVLKGKLPSGYTELEYIETGGNKYVDTGFLPNQDTRAIIDFELVGGYTTTLCIFGTRDVNAATTPIMYNMYIAGSNSYRIGYYGTNNVIYLSSIKVRTIADVNKNTTTINGVTESQAAATGQSSYSIYIGAINGKGKASYFSNIKVYSFKLYDNGVQIRDYIPCTDESGNIGLYDVINKTFSVLKK